MLRENFALKEARSIYASIYFRWKNSIRFDSRDHFSRINQSYLRNRIHNLRTKSYF